MQALQWSIDFLHRLKNAVLIATAAKLTAQNIAFNEIARQAITSDPEYRSGHYRTKDTNPDHGLMLARMIGHVTYLSDDGMANRFGRELKSGDIDKFSMWVSSKATRTTKVILYPAIRRQHLFADDPSVGLL